MTGWLFHVIVRLLLSSPGLTGRSTLGPPPSLSPRGLFPRSSSSLSPVIARPLFVIARLDRAIHRQARAWKRSAPQRRPYRLREPTGPVETICVSNELNVDLAPDGTIYGIEFLNANGQLCADAGRIVVVDQDGEQRALALAAEPPSR